MFSKTFLTAILVSAAAALYVDENEDRQAPVSVKPEIPQAYRFYRIESLETEDDETPPIKPKLYAQDDETPPIKPKQDTQASCGVTQFTFTEAGQTETLTSQRYPWDYPYNQQCSYSLTSPPGTQMTLECGTFNLACPNDQLAFSLDGGETYSSYCGRGKLALETTSGNTLLIRFTSGKSRPFSLFTRYRYKCSVKSIEGESGSGSTTTSATPVDPTPPPPAPSPSPPGSCSCGVRNINGATRIVNGVETKPGELPWRVTVFVYNPLTGRGGICGGTIISRNWVMTAAHCTMDFQPGYRINVYTGAQANPVTVGGGTKVEADRYVQHPSFNRQTLNNDISLLHLSQPLTFKSNVSPACLPYQMTSSTFSGLNVLASGWGTTKPVAEGADNNDPVSDTLLEVELPVLSTAECRAYQSVTDNMICTYKPGSDTCQGDSGGSIDYSDSSKNGRYFSIGIVSYGIGCAQEKWPGVYTKVTNYLSWIETTTQDTYCKP